MSTLSVTTAQEANSEPILTMDELAAFLADRGVPAQCPSCGQNNWFVPPANADQIIGYPLRSRLGDIPISIPHIAAAYMVCNNCGHIRTYALAVINAWKKRRSGK